METNYIKELEKVFWGITMVVVDYDISPEETEEEILKLKNKYFDQDRLGLKLYREFSTKLKDTLYSLPDLHTRKAYMTETIHLLYYDEWFNEEKVLNIFKLIEDVELKDKTDCKYNEVIFEYIKEAYTLYAFVSCKIDEICVYFDFDYEKICEKVSQIDSDREPNSKNKPLNFISLFKIPYNSNKKIQDLKEILKQFNHIDENFEWIGTTNEKTELATLYWLFEEKKNILNPGKVTPQLKTFYKEFGLIAYTDKEPPGYCTIKNINTHPGETSTYKHFASIFNDWINKN